MVKSYLKFEQTNSFGQVCSATSNAVWDPWLDDPNSTGRNRAGRAFVGANEQVLAWDIKKGEIESQWKATDNKAQVTVIERSRVDPDVFAVGYEDGKIRIWDSRTSTVIITFNGHKSAITHLRFDRSGARLASGGRDTDVILWDLVGEVGLFKLRGHKDQVTSLNFLSTSQTEQSNVTANVEPENDQFLITTSKDALIKLWDLASQHCIETHVAQTNGECWALGLSPDESGCITAGNDGELRAWVINKGILSKRTQDQESQDRVLQDQGVFYRNGRDRTNAILFHPTKDLVAIHGSAKAVEIWRIRTEDEVRKSQSRKRKRKREKSGKDDMEEEVDSHNESSKSLVTEIFVPYVIVRTSGKVRSMDWAGARPGRHFSILIATMNNQLEVFDIKSTEKHSKDVPDYERTLSVDMPGHRSDVRCLALSSDDRMIASASHGGLKVWNARTQSCLRTLDCGYALCATFLPGDKIVVVGTREGTLEIFDIASSTLIDTIPAHERDVWCLHVHPDGKSIVTGSADKSAKFWDLKVITEEVLGTNRKVPKLTLSHTRTLKVADDILSIRFSPDGRLLAVSTLDTTVKVFYVDSLKLYLTLYGHKLPVLSMDISYDSKLIVTSSADKTVRIWGLDFGDCHKSFFAHNDSILTVGFIPNNNDGNGHHFFSASKDRTIKYFDGDKFEQIQKLEGHHGEIWAMAIANSGEFIVTASHDRSIRVWAQSDELIFLEEEQERELEEMHDNTMLSSLEQDEREAMGDDVDGGVQDVGKQTVQTLMAGEKIAEALELAIEDLDVMRQYAEMKKRNPKTGYPQRNPVFLANNNISASRYVLNTFQKIPAASLQDALLVLSFSQLPTLFTFLALWASEGSNIPLTCRILFFMLKTHQKQIVSSQMMKPVLEQVKTNLRMTLQKQKNEIGFNLAGMRVMGRRLQGLEETDYYVDDDNLDGPRLEPQNQSKKRAFVNVA